MAYHSQRDGMVEQFNRTLFQILKVCVETRMTGSVNCPGSGSVRILYHYALVNEKLIISSSV